MKILFMVLCVWASVSCAEHVQEKFLRANNLYDAHQYQEALDIYQSLPTKSNSVWFNIGNCQYQLGNNQHAILAWRRAQRAAPQPLYSDAQENITQVYPDAPQGLPVYRYLLFQIVSIVLWFCGIFGVVHWYRFRPVKALVCLLIWCSVLGMGIGAWVHPSPTYGIVVKDNGVLYAGPDITYHALAGINPLEHVRIVAQRDGWYSVVSARGVGWVSQETVELV